jgi:hypothetical protein
VNSLFAVLQSLAVPVGALSDEAAIILTGSDVPPCMAGFCNSALLFRPPGSVSSDAPYYFIAINTGTPAGQSFVSIGSLVYDPTTGVCGLVRYQSIQFTRTGVANLAVAMAVGQLSSSGSGAFSGSITEDFDHYIATYDGTTTVNIDGTLSVNALPFDIDGVSAARGRRDFIASAANTAAIGAEAVVLTGASMTFITGRAYEITFAGEPLGSIANNTALYQIRRTNLAGAVRYSAAFQMSPTAGFTQHVHGRALVRNATGSNITGNVVLTLQSAGGGTVTDTGAATFPRYMEIRDIGASADYANVIQI